MTVQGGLAALILFCGCLYGSTVPFGSAVPVDDEGNYYTGINVLISPDPTWSAPIGSSQWVAPYGGEVPAGTVVEYYFNFDLIGTPGSGFVELLSSGTVLQGMVNGYQLSIQPSPNPVLPATSDLTGMLVPGSNLLQIWQEVGTGPPGIDVYGEADPISEAPEPRSALLFLSIALLLPLRRILTRASR